MDEVVTLAKVVQIVRRECSKEGHYSVADLESDLIFKAWSEELKFNDLRHVTNWVRYWIRKRVQWGSQRAHHATFLFSEMWNTHTDDEAGLLDTILKGVPARQEEIAEASRIRKQIWNWPHIHKNIVLILGEGGSVLDIAKDLGVSPAQALRYLRECQQFIANGNSLEPIKKAA